MEKFELHYYLNDESHSMDAHVRNKCEAEILGIFLELSSILNINIGIEAEALAEGGIKEVWKVFNKNAGGIGVFVAILSTAVALLPDTDQEKVDLEKQDLKLSIEERKHKIKHLKLLIKNESPTEEIIKLSKEVLNNNYKIITRKSNFYKKISFYNKISQIGITEKNSNNIQIRDEVIIERSDFHKFILHSNKLPSDFDDDAIIEIVSPVLKKENFQWKGIYLGKPISFIMKDNDFKTSVLLGNISFHNGTAIRCILEKGRKLDEVGEIQSTGYLVSTVTDIDHDGSWIETIQGRAVKFTKKQEESQIGLFDE